MCFEYTMVVIGLVVLFNLFVLSVKYMQYKKEENGDRYAK